MRLFLAIALLCLICSVSLVHGEQPAPTRPSNPITGFFKNWFGRKPPPTRDNLTAAASNVRDPLTKEDFDSALPKQSTDRMINDAISQSILDESRPQQVIAGSPFIPLPSEIEESIERSPSNNGSPGDRETAGKSMGDDSIPIAEALRIVHSSNLSDCVARVICELSCNANSYGQQGKAVFRNLIKLQFDQNVKSEDAKFFRQAATKGRQIVQGKRDCKECYTIYPSCNSSSKDLIAVSSMFKI